MAIYLKKFETQAAYEAAQSGLILPNVSLTVDNNTVHYNPSTPVPPTPTETRVVATFNVTDTSNPTQIGYIQFISGFSAIEIDGVTQPSVVSAYTFSTTGEHTIKYTLTDPTSIGSYAFTDCSSLTSIVIPDSVTSIGDGAFSFCTSLTSIDIPSGAISIGDGAFERSTGLTNVTIGSGVTSIGERAFDGCTGLTSVTINATTPSTLGSNAFGSNASGRKIYVPSASVNAYKAASGWSDYASDILPIQ